MRVCLNEPKECGYALQNPNRKEINQMKPNKHLHAHTGSFTHTLARSLKKRI